MAASREQQIQEYGWTALSCNPKEWGGDVKYHKAPVPQLCEFVTLPDSPLAQKTMAWLSSLEIRPQTWLFTCLLHDIGTIDKHAHSTFMSFECYGGILALNVLQEYDCPAPQAESVTETIIRHQNPVGVGTITTIGLLVQLATSFDNMDYRSDFVHPDTTMDVVKHYPHRNWSKCFSTEIGEEVKVKPWCHTTISEEKFPRDVEHNALMEPYDALH